MVETKMLQELLKKEQERVEELEYELEKMQIKVKAGKKLIIAIMIFLAIFVGGLCIMFKCMDAQIPYIYETTIEAGIVVEAILFGIFYYFNRM